MEDLQPSVTSAAPLIRPAAPGDAGPVHQFIVELAQTEQYPGEVTAQPEDVARALFGPHPVAEAVVATIGGEPAGFALFYLTYSTVAGRAALHLEDLYVQSGHRGAGLGRALLAHLAGLAIERGCARLDWQVLRTNEPALRFYHRLRARELDEITAFRLEGEALRDLAAAGSAGCLREEQGGGEHDD
jgi:ribosomal protein S18 acetylase RimI-like enzyme